MSAMKKEKKWLMPIFDMEDDSESSPKKKKIHKQNLSKASAKSVNSEICKKDTQLQIGNSTTTVTIINHHNWMKNFDPITESDLAVNNKKIQEMDAWFQSVTDGDKNNILLVTGPVGCGKTVTVRILARKYHMKLNEWITPLDIEIPTDNGEFEFREKQSKKFLDFIIKAANFSSLLDGNSNKLVLVEDFPNTFIRTPSEFTEVLVQYKARAKSPLVFICSETNTDNRDSAPNLFTPTLREQLQIQHISFNGVSATGLKFALKRAAEIMSKKHNSMYNLPPADMIECVVNSSGGDVRSAVTNLHFACLKGSNHTLETSIVVDKENKSKTNKRKKQASSKFMSLGKDQTVSILHGVGRVLNPKLIEGTQKFTRAPTEIIEQFLSQPSSFVNFVGENYLSHFSCIEHAEKAASALSDADYMLSEWREKLCQEYGLYVSVAGVMTANKAPVSTWNPVRGPKSTKVQYPLPSLVPLLDESYLYKGKLLVTDYQSFCKIIGGPKT